MKKLTHWKVRDSQERLGVISLLERNYSIPAEFL